ncbi:MAG TPA: hypothetical protein VKA84_11100, partial [Gemmatimonadaceae bacterium]|nr:hypothetical protein [Gemmatimonadaceae bacterium]
LVAQDVAQAPDSLPFRHGQWGALFRLDAAYASAGVLRFTSPRRAWLADVRVSAAVSHGTNSSTLDGDPFPEGRTRTSGVILQLRAGRRAYAPLGRAVVTHRGAGVLTSFDRFRSRFRSGSFESTGGDWAWGAGAFGEVGAEYLVTPRFGLGAAGQVELGYTERRGSLFESGHAVERGVNLTTSLITFTATVYF